jgi:hypothetical protein
MKLPDREKPPCPLGPPNEDTIGLRGRVQLKSTRRKTEDGRKKPEGGQDWREKQRARPKAPQGCAWPPSLAVMRVIAVGKVASFYRLRSCSGWPKGRKECPEIRSYANIDRR